jgi:S-adenosylmethionine:tRNA ribosyltransferase-isomerase
MEVIGSDGLGKVKKLSGVTDLFIQEGYKFAFIDGLITNFHVPRSSLMMLVSAFLGRKKLLALYRLAIEKKFRLFSFGDGMLIK